MTQPTIGDMIAKHREIKDFIEAADKAYAEKMKPYKDGLLALSTTCGALLQQQGIQNFKAEDGTAYLQHGLSVKVDNREAFLDFVSADNWDFLDAYALKEPVETYIDKNGAAPPGVKVEPFVKCIIRR